MKIDAEARKALENLADIFERETPTDFGDPRIQLAVNETSKSCGQILRMALADLVALSTRPTQGGGTDGA